MNLKLSCLKCERLNGLIKKFFVNHCADGTIIEKIRKMQIFADDRYRNYLLFSTTSTRKPPKDVRERRNKILNLLRIIRNNSVSYDAMKAFSDTLYDLKDI